jgi:hypothetical protein
MKKAPMLKAGLLFVFLSSGIIFAAEKKADYPPDAAEILLTAACKEAAAESKVVFMKSGYPECGYCRKFDQFHSDPEVRRMLDPHLVIISIDTRYMPDGKAVFEKYAKPGAPSWVILTPAKKIIIDSYAAQGNVGFPVKPHEVEHYLRAVDIVCPDGISRKDKDILSKQLLKAYGR